MNKKGFTLFELLAVLVFLIVAFFLVIPVVQEVIKFSRYGSFKNSALSVIDAVDYYIANNKFIEIPVDGIDISDLDSSILKNNNFESGRIIRNSDDQTELVYLVQDDYCAKGTKGNLKTSKTGCGALDETPPTKVNLFLKETHESYYTVVAAGLDDESEIIRYEISIDNGKFYSNGEQEYNVFTINDMLEHNFKVRVTNEAGLKLVSEDIKVKPNYTNTFSCVEKNNQLVSKYKEITCDLDEEYNYQYSFDGTNWNNLDNNTLKIDKNGTIIMRQIKGDTVISTNTFNINNIDTELNGAIPELDENMIPVVYDKDKGWVVANRDSIYWDYNNKIWANAVVVRKNAIRDDDLSRPREFYLSKNAIGEKVYEKDILAYYVWIPRFKYKLWNITGTDIKQENHGIRNIEIEFTDSNEINNNKNYKNNEWYIHGAFSYLDEINGFWVNKYEASIASDATCTLVPNSDNCNKNYFDIYSIPNRNSLKFISLDNSILLVDKLNEEFNKYGLSNKSHILTNLEWGAIAYLSHSKYGVMNSVKENTTTGNETGVYSMGIGSEFVMANYNNEYGNIDSSIFTDRLIDNYNSISTKGRILGDSTLETEKWYESKNKFLSGTLPFMIRGENSIFDFDATDGVANNNITFRTTLWVSHK